MGFKCGIVGLPNVGKSTLYNALTNTQAAADNYPFCTIDPNVGIVPVPDPRLDTVAEISASARVVPATMEFVDIAGLVAGASKGEGLGNKFLAHIRETQAVAHVVRCFRDDDITHVSGRVSPADDIETINTELMLADLDSVTKATERLQKVAKSGDKAAGAELETLSRVLAALESGEPVRSLDLDKVEREHVKSLSLISAKPVLYVANVAEDGFADNPLLDDVAEIAARESAGVVSVCASIEAELVMLDAEARAEFLADMGLEEPGLSRVIRAGYELLGLQTFLTSGPKESRAWTVWRGATAQQAAGRIHTDFARGFIRAEIASFDDFVYYRGENGAKEAGRLRAEGKEYIMRDGDVVNFRFNV